MNRVMRSVVVLGALVVGSALCWSNEKDEKLAKLMKELHEGKSAPLTQVKKELDGTEPSWKSLKKDADAFVNLGKELVKAKGEKNRAALAYRDSAIELAAAVEKQQKPEAAKAFQKLNRTCSSCHYGR